MELGKMAIDYSDAVIEAGQDVNLSLMDYAKEKKLPFLDYPGEDYASAYNAFYDKLL